MNKTDDYYLAFAKWIAKKATCPKKQVGCVIIDNKQNLLSTGYNTVSNRCKSCILKPCSKRFKKCHAIHAEALALLKCSDIKKIDTIYVTLSPCFDCAKLIVMTNCKRVVYLENYKKNDGLELLKKNNIEVIKYEQ